MLEVAAGTDVGVQRRINEDHYLVDEVHKLYVLCDGMGGHAGGEVASRMGSENIVNFVKQTRIGQTSTLPYPVDPNLPPEANRLSMAIRWANHVVYDTAARNPAVQGMGTTVVALLVHESVAYVAHVGDSRVYRLRGDRLEQLTRDHSEINELIDAGQISPDEAWRHPDKNVITKALGVDPDVIPTIRMERIKDGDMFLMCSDGVSDLISDRKLQEMMTQAREPDGKGRSRLRWLAEELIKQANRQGGKDNITAIVVRSGP